MIENTGREMFRVFFFLPRCPEGCDSFKHRIHRPVLAIRILLLLYVWETETEMSFNHELDTVLVCRAWPYLISMQPLLHKFKV